MSNEPLIELSADDAAPVDASQVPAPPASPEAPAPQLPKEPVTAVAKLPPPPPFSFEFLAQNMRKHVDPKAPVPLRMMGAKGLVPLSPPDLCAALFLLTFDPDEAVRDTATKTASSLPDRILSMALRDEGVQPPVLGFFLRVLGDREVYAEMLILNGATPDVEVAEIAQRCSVKLAEIIGQNQLRLLRHDDVVRQLCRNPHVTAALTDSVCDFAVRSGLNLPDVPQMQEARIRLFGADQPPVDEGPTAQAILDEYEELTDETSSQPLEEGKRLTINQKILKMSVAEKIKLATKGNKEARSLLIRDSNKLVAVAVIRSPRITDGEVMAVANNRAAMDDVLRVVYSNREWLKSYPLRLALVKNAKVPMAVSMRFLNTLREAEVKELARNKNISSGVQMMAKKMMDKKNTPKKDDGH
jgi:hypothetical protein